MRPGEVTILVFPADEDSAGAAWAKGVAREWEDELADERQDIYSMSDGEPLHES